MDRTLGAEHAGQLVPLAARAHPEDDAVQRLTPVGVVSARCLGGPERKEQRENAFPEWIGHSPDGPQRLAFAGLLPFASLSCCSHWLALPGEPLSSNLCKRNALQAVLG